MENGKKTSKPARQDCRISTALCTSDIPLPLKSFQVLLLVPICFFSVSDSHLEYKSWSYLVLWPAWPWDACFILWLLPCSHKTQPSSCSGSRASQEAAESRCFHHSFRLQHYSSVKRKLGTAC